MKINQIPSYNTIPNKLHFNGFSTPEMREIFENPKISVSSKKDLWELSEIPNFNEAIQGTPKEDIIEILNKIKKSQTNILKMIFTGDVHFGVIRDGHFDVFKLLSLDNIAQNNANPNNPKENLLDVILRLPIQEIEEQAQANFHKKNLYDDSFIAERPSVREKLLTAAQLQKPTKEYLKYLYKRIGNRTPKFSKNGVMLFFDKSIVGKNMYVPHYSPTPIELIGRPITELPEDIKKSSKLSTIDDFVKIPYFCNLLQYEKDTGKSIFLLGRLNSAYDNLIARILSKNIQFTVLNPLTEEVFDMPIVDLEKLVADQKFGICPKCSLGELLSKNTNLFSVFTLYAGYKDHYPDSNVVGIEFSIENETLVSKYIEDDGTVKGTQFDANNPIVSNFCKFLNKLPYKTCLVKMQQI